MKKKYVRRHPKKYHRSIRQLNYRHDNKQNKVLLLKVWLIKSTSAD